MGGEPPHIREERKSLTAQLQVLAKAHNVLTRDPTLAAIVFDAEDEVAEQQVARPKPAANPTSPAGLRPPAGGMPAPAATMPNAGYSQPQPAAVPQRPAPAPAAGGGGLF